MDIHTYRNISMPSDDSFLYQTGYVRRAGIIPFFDYEDQRYILLGLSKEDNPVWADLGGRAEKGETTIETAFREFKEESRNVLPIYLHNIEMVMITNEKGHDPDQALFFVRVPMTDYNLNINIPFQETLPQNQYEDEMIRLQWLSIHLFKKLPNRELSRSLKYIKDLCKQLSM